LDLMRMARPGLAVGLRAALHECRKQNESIRKEGIKILVNGDSVAVDIEVHPLGKAEDLHYLVLFKETPAPGGQAPIKNNDAEAGEGPQGPEYDNLLQELNQTKETMQSIIEEQEATNEELRAANEEIQSANEELQSTNEELETAKEELQSTNEELTTLNAELERQNIEANQAIDDFDNLHRGLDIPVILLDSELCIRSFTPPAERQLGLRRTDTGRNIQDLRIGLAVDDLDKKIRGVLDTLETVSEDVPADSDRWYSLRIRPYRTSDDRITGAVLVLVDITQRRQDQAELQNARVLAQSIVSAVRHPMIVLDVELRVVQANPAFYQSFQVSQRETESHLLYDLGNGQWDIPELRRRLENVAQMNARIDEFVVEHDFPGIGRKRVVADARRIEQEGDRPDLILLSLTEVSDAT
ncbi:MAG: PAS domain-containing protein, partial [Candidatus Eisenbacteria bacterium]|nr:PAS domain-containing protein [Candidatus Eisenbacteria bacterium]